MVKFFKIIEKIVWIIAALTIAAVLAMVFIGAFANLNKAQFDWSSYIPYFYGAAAVVVLYKIDFTISLTRTDSITSAGSVALYWPNSINRFMSRICHVLIAHIMYLFYFYSSSYNLFINWGQTGDKTCDKACDKLVTSSSFLQGIAKTSFSSALASYVISTYFS